MKFSEKSVAYLVAGAVGILLGTGAYKLGKRNAFMVEDETSLNNILSKREDWKKKQQEKRNAKIAKTAKVEKQEAAINPA